MYSRAVYTYIIYTNIACIAEQYIIYIHACPYTPSHLNLLQSLCSWPGYWPAFTEIRIYAKFHISYLFVVPFFPISYRSGK